MEEITFPFLRDFCQQRGLYLDRQGYRGKARNGRKVCWKDQYGNSHDLDFVIEQGGTSDKIGRPIAFIEVAWRRYTKHSKNKAQEIQGAVLPIAETYQSDRPFLGVILAGEFTQPSLEQLRSVGFEVLYFPYKTITSAFSHIGINAEFNESTLDSEFTECVNEIIQLSCAGRTKIKQFLVNQNKENIENFFFKLEQTLDRRIDSIMIVPLYGDERQFPTIHEALHFLETYEKNHDGQFRKFEILVKYTNGDSINGNFQTKNKAREFLDYIFHS